MTVLEPRSIILFYVPDGSKVMVAELVVVDGKKGVVIRKVCGKLTGKKVISGMNIGAIGRVLVI